MRRTLALGLAMTLTAAPARAGGSEGPRLDAGQWAQSLIELGDRRAEARDHVDALKLYFGAYDRLAADPAWRDRVGALHPPLEKGLNAAADVQQMDPSRVDLLCEADRRLALHAERLAEAGHLTPAAVDVVRAARGRLAYRLAEAGARCAGGLPIRLDLARRIAPAGIEELMANEPTLRIVRLGAFARATRTVVVPLPSPAPRRNRGAAFTAGGVALMTAGLLGLGAGLALAGRDEREAGAALSFVAGAGMLVAGFPMLIVGDQKRRAGRLALGPRGLGVAGAF